MDGILCTDSCHPRPSAKTALTVLGVALAVLTGAACGRDAANHRTSPRVAARAEGDLVIRREPNAPNPPQTLTMRSELLAETRRIYVQLPEGYEDSTTRFPVLVVLDGEWLFELARANARFFSEYEAMDVDIPRMIVVGIENTDRDRDFTPTTRSGKEYEFPTAGGADRFLKFLDQELLPLLDREYRTAPGRIVAGWSFGGLLATYVALAMPDLFDAHLCISPAIWWDDDLVFERFKTARFDAPKRMLFSLGSNERGGWVDVATRRLLKRLEDDPIQNLRVSRLELEGVGHSWGIPAAFDKGLQELFSGFLAPAEETGSLADVTAYYDRVSDQWGFHVEPPTPVMLALAAAQDDANEAIAIIDRLLEVEPDAALAYYYKGKLQLRLERREAALGSFRDALAAELRRDVPERANVRLFTDAMTKTEKGEAGSPG